MFTIKFMNYSAPFDQDGSVLPDKQDVELVSVYIRERDAVEIWLPSSSVYRDRVDELCKETMASDEHDDETKSMLCDLHRSYKAMLTMSKDGDDDCYYVAEYEEVYVTDSSGKTVHIIK